jgi:hypothetical protein
MNRNYENYALLIGRAIEKMPPTATILLHTYDNANPTGAGVVGGESWLRSALEAAGVPPSLPRECVKFLIDSHTKVLDKLSLPERIVVVDSRQVLADADWANELHPTAAGFRKIVDQKWLPELGKLGLA